MKQPDEYCSCHHCAINYVTWFPSLAGSVREMLKLHPQEVEEVNPTNYPKYEVHKPSVNHIFLSVCLCMRVLQACVCVMCVLHACVCMCVSEQERESGWCQWLTSSEKEHISATTGPTQLSVTYSNQWKLDWAWQRNFTCFVIASQPQKTT